MVRILLLLFCLDSATPPEKKIRLGLDLRGGTSFLLQLVPQNGQEITSDMLQQAVDVIRKRVDPNGGGESMIAPQGSRRILVQIPGLDPAQIQTTREQLQRVAKLEFAEVHPDSTALIAQIDNGDAILPPGYVIKEQIQPSEGKENVERLLVKKEADLTGDHNPIHLSDHFARKTRFGGRIAHGLYTASLISAVLGMRLPGPGAVYLSQTLNFRAPVRIGDVVSILVEVVELDPEKKRCRLKCEALVDGKVVLDGEALVMVPSRNSTRSTRGS